MEQIFNFKVDAEHNKERIDKWLASQMPQMSRVRVQKLLDAGFVLDSNDEVVADKKLRVIEGDEYVVRVVEDDVEQIMEPENIPLDILYQDDDIVVVNKPAGMVVHKGAGQSSGTLVNALLYHLDGKLSSIGLEAGRPGIVHRLDKDTSGVMMVCKSDVAHLEMYKQFANHSVNRNYVAMLWGMPTVMSGKIDKNIARNPKSRQEMKVVAEGIGKRAVTNYQVLEVFSGPKFKPLSLVKLKLETGRTHQIRVHMASMGVPVLGDAVYGNPSRHIMQIENEEVRELVKSVSRQLLHSKVMEFVHPISKKVMKFSTPVPHDMKKIIEFFGGEYGVE